MIGERRHARSRPRCGPQGLVVRRRRRLMPRVAPCLRRCQARGDWCIRGGVGHYSSPTLKRVNRRTTMRSPTLAENS